MLALGEHTLQLVTQDTKIPDSVRSLYTASVLRLVAASPTFFEMFEVRNSGTEKTRFFCGVLFFFMFEPEYLKLTLDAYKRAQVLVDRNQDANLTILRLPLEQAYP